MSQLKGRRIIVPETRQLDTFAQMLEAEGAHTDRISMISIHDNPDAEPVHAWIDALIADHFDYVLLYTGEGLRRLKSFATARGQLDELCSAMGRTHTIVRGPKPAKECKLIGQPADTVVKQATTDGLLAALPNIPLDSKRLGLQVSAPGKGQEIIDACTTRQCHVDVVAPYVYGKANEDTVLAQLIIDMAAQSYDAIAFTSSTQVRRLADVAQAQHLEDELDTALHNTCIAAVGPVAAEALRELGVTDMLMPESSFFMRPLVRSLIDRFSEHTHHS